MKGQHGELLTKGKRTRPLELEERAMLRLAKNLPARVMHIPQASYTEEDE